ncbi:secretion protein EspA [Ewingella americana]|uniref:secretion protein EspA n=1 Tax=Ewingella americana TaxID=41202 RepID=UPI0012AE0515|nr:secretion protein EspA [Ewingella americana]MRT05903.1 secretion protein EspA [Ewingella americana]
MNAVNNSEVVYLSNSQVNTNYDNKPTSAGFSGSDLLQGDSVFSGGLMTLYMFMQMLSDQANGKYSAMDAASENSRKAQEASTAIDKIIAELAAKGNNKGTADIPSEVAKYIEENHLEIPGVCGFIRNGEWAWGKEVKMNSMNIIICDGEPQPLNQAEFNAIKSALENVANRASDFVSSSQLQLQKLMQTYNVNVSLINSMQTMLADMNKTIAQGIR